MSVDNAGEFLLNSISPEAAPQRFLWCLEDASSLEIKFCTQQASSYSKISELYAPQTIVSQTLVRFDQVTIFIVQNTIVFYNSTLNNFSYLN